MNIISQKGERSSVRVVLHNVRARNRTEQTLTVYAWDGIIFGSFSLMNISYLHHIVFACLCAIMATTFYAFILAIPSSSSEIKFIHPTGAEGFLMSCDYWDLHSFSHQNRTSEWSGMIQFKALGKSSRKSQLPATKSSPS